MHRGVSPSPLLARLFRFPWEGEGRRRLVEEVLGKGGGEGV